MAGAPPTIDAIAELAERALEAIPKRLLRHIQGVGIAVEDMPDDEMLDQMGIESPWDLTGLYRGTPLTQRSASPTKRTWRSPAGGNMTGRSMRAGWCERARANSRTRLNQRSTQRRLAARQSRTSPL